MAMQASRWSAPSRAIAWVLIASFLTASCASRNVPPIGAGGQPFKPESDEVSLWKQAEKEEETLTKKAKIYDDPLLDEYLGKIADRLLPDEVRAAGGPGLRFGVMSDPTLHLYYGDLYRLQSQRARSVADKDDFAKNALEHYELSAGLDPTFPDPFRQLGFLYYQQKDSERARDAFKKYLALKPDAPDAKRIREYLVELER